ncbi:LysR family transcriptional regulator [Cupriavidus numazuensis]|nr:LysR family transcriptional regulator [Cupriavidus numazuensis]
MQSPKVFYARLMSGARFRHLQAFVAVAELGSANRAAEAVGMTQPAITNLIADLEQLLECTLFHRHARGMRMTAVGQELLPFMRQALVALEEGTEFVAFRRKESLGIARVGAIQAAISGFLVRALPAFSRARPDVMIELQEANAAQSSALISHRKIDLMLCRPPEIVPEGWEFSELFRDRMAVVCGPAHPLAHRGPFQFEELATEVWLLTHPSTEARRIFDELMVRHGTEPEYRKLKTRSFDMTLAQLQSEALLMLTPFSIVRHMVELGQLVLLDVADMPAFQPVGVLNLLEELGEAAMMLKAFLCRFAAENP